MPINDDDSEVGQSKADTMNAEVNQGKKWPTPEEVEPVAKAASEASTAQAADTKVGGEAPALDHPSYEALEIKLTETEQKLNDYWNEVMRSRAEMENTRKRCETDVLQARKFALTKFAGDLLPIVDSLSQALACEYGDNQFARSIHEGVEMTMNMLLQTFERFGIKQIDPVGAIFDPNLHQAVSTEEVQGMKTNTVVRVLQKGYSLNDRLIRPAMVIVAK